MSSPPPLRLLYAGTCRPNTTPQSVHEIRFKRPVHLHSFRILCDGEAPHAEIPAIVGQTPNVQLGVEFFGGEHGKQELCVALLAAAHRRTELSAPSAQAPPRPLAAHQSKDRPVQSAAG